MTKLWASWEPDAVVGDRTGGLYVDPDKVHPLDDDGKYYKSAGFAFCEPSPQGRPVLFQAGSSSAGRDFCAKWAEAAFAILASAAQMGQFVRDMSERSEHAGRGAGTVKCMFGVQPVVGRTEGEAREKQQTVYELMGTEAALTIVSGHTGIDFSQFDRNASVRDIPLAPGVQGIFESLRQDANEENLTVEQAARRYAQSTLLLPMVGTPRQVADQMISAWEESGAAGFLVTPIYYPGAITEFVDTVVPLLQKAKVFRHAYTGATLRDHLNQTSLGA